MRAKEFLKDHPQMKDGVHEHALTTDSAITGRDYWDVSRCDAVLFNLVGAEKVSIGTMIEYGWASAFNKPRITIMERRGNIHDHPIVRNLTTFRAYNLEEGLNLVRAIFAY
jgi:nucleoside 2-deoxyribosyltransferase